MIKKVNWNATTPQKLTNDSLWTNLKDPKLISEDKDIRDGLTTTLKQHILRCDTSNLNSDCIEALIKYMPQPHTIKKLREMFENGVELMNVEEFVANLGDIERLVPRLQCMNFMLNYNDAVKNMEPKIKAGAAACKEITSSVKLDKILEVILSIGNMMNSGLNSNEATGATGFELSILT